MSELCLLCGESFEAPFNLAELWSWRPLAKALLCPTCRAGFLRLTPPYCPNCGRTMSEGASGPCLDCQRWAGQGFRPQHEAFFHYNEGFKTWLLLYKARGDIRLGPVMAPRLQAWRAKYPKALWLPLPSSAGSFARRGFQQTVLLLKQASLPYQEAFHLLDRQAKQAGRKRSERLHDHRPLALRVDFKLPKETELLLFDDVYTTGTTMYRAYQALAEAGYQQVHSLSLAR